MIRRHITACFTEEKARLYLYYFWLSFSVYRYLHTVKKYPAFPSRRTAGTGRKMVLQWTHGRGQMSEMRIIRPLFR